MDATDYSAARAWPFEEARKLIARVERSGKQDVLFETGYGPSGLPHIGTFGEVARTTMVRNAFGALTGDSIKTRLICFSDDMDGMRKVPDNIPDGEKLEPYLQMPLTAVPDPFGTHESFGAHNNARLRAFLDTFGFDYEFASATEYYKSGKFDDVLLRAVERYDEIMAVMLPTLGPERRASYSPFLPISPESGRVLYVPMKEVNASDGTITFEDEDGRDVTIPVTGGHCKLQWKPDFGMRWAALDVDFEMFGKDHQTNAQVYDRICRILGGQPPEHFVYELFLDDKGEKISKSKGNGISIEEWLRYATPESLALYMFQSPRKAKRLYFDVIPKAVDDYLTFLEKYHQEPPEKRIENPAWHIHAGQPPQEFSPISFSLLLNLVGAAHSDDPAVIWGFIRNYVPDATPENHPMLDRLVGYAIAYYEDFVHPTKRYRAPDEREREALLDLERALAAFGPQSTAEEIQTEVYEVGKRHGFENLRDWFKALYETLLGQSQGPRMGSFIKLFGVDETKALIGRVLEGADLNAE